MPTCAKCQTEKPIDQFYRIKARGGGPSSYCKSCTCDMTNAHKAANKTRILADAKRYREAHPDAVRIAKKRSYDKKRTEYNRKSREARLADPERARARGRAWKAANREKVYDALHRRRARKLGNGPVDKIDRRVVYDRDGGACWLCHQPVAFAEMHLDHVVPLSRGGTHTWDNVKTAHGTCNLRKHAKLPAEVQ